jgi:hypothetical protein
MGHPIPAPTHSFDPHPATTRIVDVAVGHVAEVVSIGGSERTRLFLGAEGITTGARLIVLGAGASGLLVKAGALVYLDSELAATIHVRTVGPEGALSISTASGSSC